ncbi:hypothetical protein C8R45DRAFT_495634 [Mycena sanguinolenta]|nr:hypothetical protein C8R45DRAFT_495634 [Mycena sanguinolenta]
MQCWGLFAPPPRHPGRICAEGWIVDYDQGWICMLHAHRVCARVRSEILLSLRLCSFSRMRPGAPMEKDESQVSKSVVCRTRAHFAHCTVSPGPRTVPSCVVPISFSCAPSPLMRAQPSELAQTVKAKVHCTATFDSSYMLNFECVGGSSVFREPFLLRLLIHRVSPHARDGME